jgi:hypothetical protein
MFHPSRREVLHLSGAAAALGLSGSLTFLPSAIAQEVRDKGFYGYKIGDIQCTALYDGIWEKEHEEGFVAMRPLTR